MKLSPICTTFVACVTGFKDWYVPACNIRKSQWIFCCLSFIMHDEDDGQIICDRIQVTTAF